MPDYPQVDLEAPRPNVNTPESCDERYRLFAHLMVFETNYNAIRSYQIMQNRLFGTKIEDMNYSTSQSAGSRYRHKPEVQAYIKQFQKQAYDDANISRERVALKLAVFSNLEVDRICSRFSTLYARTC